MSADLRVLIAQSGKNFKEVAAAAGISSPALSKKLGGDSNLTLDSIFAIAQAVGADFDIVFREVGDPRARQPWERDATADDMLGLAEILLEEIKVRHAESYAMKKTWDSRLRAMFRSSPYHVRHKHDYETVCANDDSPIAIHG